MPGRSRVVIDVRTTEPALTEDFVAAIDAKARATPRAARVERTGFATLSEGPPVACDPTLRQVLRDSAQALGLSATDLAERGRARRCVHGAHLSVGDGVHSLP